jgi:hypothetical protein
MLIVNLEQGSEAWFKEKLGKPSASNISKIITNTGKPSTQRLGYLYELAGQILTGKQEEGYKNANIELGNEREGESRNYFELTHNAEITQVGVIYKDEQKKFLCSPDGIELSQEYGLELKNVLPKTQVQYLLDNSLPSNYFGQCQMSLYITGFKYWQFLSYVPLMNPLLIRVEPDKVYQEILGNELNKFCMELEETVKKIK